MATNKDLNAKEVVKLMEGYVEKMMKVVQNYQVAVQSIDKAVTDLDEYRKSWWLVYKSYIVAGIVALIIIGAYITYKVGGDCKLSFESPSFSFEVAEKGCEK